MNLDPELQKELMKDGEIQRQKIDDNVEKLLDAALKGQIDKVTQILKEKEADKDFVNETDANKRTALHFAVHGGFLEVIKVLLQHNAQIDAQDWEGYTPLMYGLKSNKIDIAHFLIEKGADVNIVTTKGVTPLHTAVMAQNTDLVKLLIEKGVKAMPGKEPECGSALHFAVSETDTTLAELLIGYEPQLVNSLDANHMIPLHFACAMNNTKMAVLLIEKGSDVNRASSDGTTALHIASDTGNVAIVKSLVSHGAVQKMDASGHTPIMAASKSGNKELEALLKDLKIDYTTVSNKDAPKTNKIEEKLSAETLKNNGNDAFTKQDYDMALHWYNLAIDVDSIYCEIQNKPTALGHILFSNRSTTYYHQKNYQQALADAEHAIQLAPNWPKGYLRKGAALAALGKKEEAQQCFDKQKELEKK